MSWADRIAYTAHDLEDAVHAGVVSVDDLPPDVATRAGTDRRQQLKTFIGAVVACMQQHGVVGMDADTAGALAALREFNYERIYTRPASRAQADAVIAVLRALVEHFADHPLAVPDALPVEPGSPDAVRAAVAYVGGMTDRFAFRTAVAELDWDPARLPRGIDVPRRP